MFNNNSIVCIYSQFKIGQLKEACIECTAFCTSFDRLLLNILLLLLLLVLLFVVVVVVVLEDENSFFTYQQPTNQ
jgi:hypothetical protein